MFVDNAVVKKVEVGEVYDKSANAATLLDVSFKGASCEGCNMRYLCGKIDEIVKHYREKTTVVTESFSFV